MSETIAEPKPSSEAESENIIRLTNQTFERLMPRFVPYMSDERRRRGEDGATLTADNEGVLWEGGIYGRVPIVICNQASLKRVAQSFADNREVREATGPLSSDRSHYGFIQESKVVGGPDNARRYTIGGVALLLHATRDRYPRGVVDARETLWADDRDRGQYPESAYGERHKVGIELVTKYHDALAPARPATWRFGMSVQTRFDKPAPQWEMKSKFQGLVDTFDIERTGYGRGASFKPELSQVREPSSYDVSEMQRIFTLAKDIRPQVTPIARQLKQQAAFGAMFEKFFSPESSTSAPVE